MTGAKVGTARRPAMTHGDILRGRPCSPLQAVPGLPCLGVSVGLFVRLPDAFHRARTRPHVILGAGLLRQTPDVGVATSLIVPTSIQRRLEAPSVAVPDRP